MLTLFAADYTGLYVDRRKLGRLEKENRHLKQKLKTAGRRLGELEQNVRQIDDFSKKLKRIIKIPPAQIGRQRGGGEAHSGWREVFLSESPFPSEESPIAPTEKKAQTYEESFPREGTSALFSRMEGLTDKTGRLKQDIWSLYTDITEEQEILLSSPSIMPVRGWISSSFGYRNESLYFDHEPHFHRGVDIAALEGRPVRASADGKVIYAGYDESGYGYLIIISHGHGLKTLYAHLAEIKTQEGRYVTKGEEIGLVGNTGRSTGPHLHYEVRIFNQPVNPENYILDKNDLLSGVTPLQVYSPRVRQ